MSYVERKVGFGPAFMGGIAALVVVGAIASWWFRAAAPKEDDYQIQRGKVRLEKRSEIEKEALDQLTVAAITDAEKGVVRVPIERAMQLVAAELANKPVRPSEVSVEVPYPYGLRPPAPAAEPAVEPAAEPGAAETAPAVDPSAPSVPSDPSAQSTEPAPEATLP